MLAQKNIRLWQSAMIVILVSVIFIPALFLSARNGRAADQKNVVAEGATTLYLPLVIDIEYWNNPMGFEINPSLTDATYQQRTKELGVGWVRLNQRVSWKTVQPVENGPYNWDELADFEQELLFLKSVGAKPIVIIGDYPAWATDNSVRTDGQPTSCGPLLPEKYRVFANFAAAVVQRYSVPHFNVKDWELGNEVDVDPNLIPPDSQFGCWGDNDDTQYYGGDDYGRMVKKVGLAIKAADPQARVWIGGLVLAQPDILPAKFLSGVLSVGAAPYFDILPFHAHTQYYHGDVLKDPFSDTSLMGPWEPLGGLLGKSFFLREVMKEYGVDKPLFVNELGVGCVDKYPACNPPVAQFYDFKAAMLVRIITRVNADGIDGFIWYTLNGPAWRNMGLLDINKQPTLAFDAYQHHIDEIYGSSYLSPRSYGEGIEAYTFSLDDRQVDVVWTQDDVSDVILVPQSKFIAARNLYGEPLEATDVGTSYQIPVGFEPIYVERNP